MNYDVHHKLLCINILAVTISDEENEKYHFYPVLPRLQDDNYFMREYVHINIQELVMC